MKKLLDFYNKYSELILAVGAAAWILVGLFGQDIIGRIFLEINLYFLLRIVYILIGLAGVVKLLQMYRPDVIEKITGPKK